MKMKRSSSASPRPNGILRWSTLCVLAGGLASCEKEESYTFTEKDAAMANLQSGIDKLDSQHALLKAGEVANNFQMDGVGYYHAERREFFPQPYNLRANDGRYFVDGSWQAQPGPDFVPPSRPSPESLKKIDAALTEARKEEEKSGGNTASHSGGGFSGTNMLLMYMLLSGNRGLFSPGAGFQQTDRNPADLNRRAMDERRTAAGHASANPGYRRAVEQSRMQGTPVKPGQSVRGGFGASRSSEFTSGS
ncbi:MAG: hypothetical protein KF712_18660 [Akkermansiaceae bacterium]|nr:hypothetical protein [Akkermansiaceae bacterium]